MRRGLVGVGLIAVMLLLALISVTAWARGEVIATPGPLPGRQSVTSTPSPDGWRLTGGIEMKLGEDGTWRIEVDVWLRPETGEPVIPTPTPTTPATNMPTLMPTSTSTLRPTNTATPTPTATPSPTPIATGEPITPTPEDACVVRSTANVNARTLPIVRSDTGIGVLPADSPVRITGYYLEQTVETTYTWYRYWFNVDHPEAWSRSDFFTERDDSPGCQLLPRVVEP